MTFRRILTTAKVTTAPLDPPVLMGLLLTHALVHPDSLEPGEKTYEKFRMNFYLKKLYFSCETDINECDNSPCKNGATCHDMIAVAQCTCAANYTGQFCELLVLSQFCFPLATARLVFILFQITVDCASNPCMHGSTCRDLYKGTQVVSFFLI